MPQDADLLKGAQVAAILTGAWRAEVPRLDMDLASLQSTVAYLTCHTAAALVWNRLRASGLHHARWTRDIRQVWRTFALESSGHEQHLQQVLPLLRNAGVEPILIKGWSMARHYPDTALRPYGDLDLCVEPTQVKAAITVLEGFAQVRQWNIELHQGVPDLKDRTWSEIMGRSRLAILGKLEVRVLGPEDQFRLHSLHLMRHGACMPLWLCDLAVLLESLPSDFDWERCLHGHPARAAWIICFAQLAGHLLGARLDRLPTHSTVELPRWLGPTVLTRWARPLHESKLLDPIKSAFRRRLMPNHSLPMTNFLGFIGRAAEVPSRLWRQYWRWRTPSCPSFELHLEKGA